MFLRHKALIFRPKREAQGAYFEAQGAYIKLLKIGGKDHKYGQ